MIRPGPEERFERFRVTPVSILTSKQARHQLGKAKMAKLEEFLGGQQ